MIFDGFIIFGSLLLGVIQAKRGTLRAAGDLAAAIISLKLTYSLQKHLAEFFFNTLHFSPIVAGIISSILIFSFFFFIIHFIASVLYGMTLFSIGEGFEQPIAFGLGVATAAVIFRFLLVLIMTFIDSPTVKEMVNDSFFAHQLYTLTFWYELMERLKPLMHPEDIYL